MSPAAARMLARLDAAGVALYGAYLVAMALLLKSVVGGAKGEIATIVGFGAALLLLAPFIWREVVAAVVAAPLVGLAGSLVFGLPAGVTGVFIGSPLIFGLLATLYLLLRPRRG